MPEGGNMKKLLFLVLTVSLLAALACAQGDTTPIPRPTPNPVLENQQTQDAMRRANDLNRRSDELQMTQKFPVKVPEKERAFRELIEPLYRNSTDEERAFMAPDAEDSASYRDFLKQKNTGIIKLVADRGCADNAKVVNASIDCSRYPMPGAGSGYSFRFGDYRMHHISDIVFRNGKFEALGVLNHGIMVNLGDVPIDSVTEKSEGVNYLVKVRPSKDFTEAADLATKLTKGIKNGGRTYASILPMGADSTYVLRSIAYEGEAMRKVGPYAYNEMDLDKRRDVLVVFRVVRVSKDEVTLVWKQLDDRKAPKLKANNE
jgi:hypothetical protein